MASILDKYGIKEVADVTFYELNNAGMPTSPVLYLDTLKVSTIEQTAETAEARGGKGNPPLIMWDYGKEINVTLEDALFSAKSMAIMFGNGKVKEFSSKGKTDAPAQFIMKTEVFVATADGTGNDWSTVGWVANYEAPDGNYYKKLNPKYFDQNDKEVELTAVRKEDKIFCTYDLAATGSIIEISSNSFPGTYYVTGDTFARSEASGKDEFFQFVIPKAKVQSENTITLEAEGDPSVFNMSLRVLRPADGKMMKLIKYNLEDAITGTAEDSVVLIHNHDLGEEVNG
jgi:hypothetical protein